MVRPPPPAVPSTPASAHHDTSGQGWASHPMGRKWGRR